MVGNVLRDLFWLGTPFGKGSRAGEGATYIALSLWNSSPSNPFPKAKRS